MKKLKKDNKLINKVKTTIDSIKEYFITEEYEFGEELHTYLMLTDIKNLGFYEKEMNLSNEEEDPTIQMDLVEEINSLTYYITELLLQKFKKKNKKQKNKKITGY